MKKLIFVFFVFCMSFYAHAQVNPHALGLRFGGDGSVNGAEISYQHGIGNANRLEFDLGFASNKNHNRTFVTVIYHWDWRIVDAFNWYIGPGVGLGLFSYDNAKSYLNVSIGGQIGIEYDFKRKGVPILLSIDARPMWDAIGDHAGLGWGAALGVRYIW
jgi:opacity protein-like surface antigen